MRCTAYTVVARSSLTITFPVHYRHRPAQCLIPFVDRRPYADDDDVVRYYDADHCWMSRITIDLDWNDEGYPLSRPQRRYSVSSDDEAVADAVDVAFAVASGDFADVVEVAVGFAAAVAFADAAAVAAVVAMSDAADDVAVTSDYHDVVMM